SPASAPCLARALTVDRAVAALPAPVSEMKGAFLASLTAAGPVITSIPRVDRPAGIPFLAAIARRLDWRVVSGLAAAGLVGVGLWAASGPRPSQADVPGPRHELLARGVDFVADMSKARTPRDRAGVSLSL